MSMKIILASVALLVFLIYAFVYDPAAPALKAGATYTTVLKTMSDTEYPDNNAIGFRSKLVGQYSHNSISFTRNTKGNFDITILPGNGMSDTIHLSNINLLEMMPTVPDFVKGNKVLTRICLLNQEWNRIQVRFSKEYFTVKGQGNEDAIISRVDLANNCLRKGLWECILFTKENDKEVLYFQSWFDFPSELYNALFEERNGLSIAPFDSMLINYDHTLVGSKVELKKLRTISPGKVVNFESRNDALYPLIGERQTKAKNIIVPSKVTSINDFLTDSTKYATFEAPGYYTRANPRATQLSRLQKLEKVTVSKATSNNSAKSVGMEFHLYFTSADGATSTEFVIGGIQKERIPALTIETHVEGFQMPMGISNHSFYNSYSDLLKYTSRDEPYFAFLLDKDGNWLDSHDIGIDGPLFWFDQNDPTKLHLMILSFERHSFVGHYIIDLPTDFLL